MSFLEVVARFAVLSVILLALSFQRTSDLATGSIYTRHCIFSLESWFGLGSSFQVLILHFLDGFQPGINPEGLLFEVVFFLIILTEFIDRPLLQRGLNWIAHLQVLNTPMNLFLRLC